MAGRFAGNVFPVDVLDGAPIVAWLGSGRAYARWADGDGLPAAPRSI